MYRFLVDGVWRCDETKPFVRDEYGLISNEVLVENNVLPVVQPEPSIRGTNMDKGTILKTMPLEPSSQNPSMQIAVIRHVVSGILLHNTIYDVVPLSSKLTVLDTQLPVKQAFKIMHDVGLALVPFWDDRQGTITGMLTASDFVLILRKLQRNIQVIGNEEPISAWKEAKLQFYGGPDGAVMQRTPLIHATLISGPRKKLNSACFLFEARATNLPHQISVAKAGLVNKLCFLPDCHCFYICAFILRETFCPKKACSARFKQVI
ncbi:sucrose nonfermenting 4-like protein isoform X3 [Zea mays]|uniref:sucrose nonfermenting 4-like protein isoform X3 n=1 Tax=Zea mays TaxID=4577 RepID=UPI0004DEA617|nr:sucrose nonfermenting 4-like protein isoform X3 [Zea mays]XP_035817721.1 sucrose nonfermenting 4-like protein isoform X3 [Zea mays]|eukprot:XP_020397803.1 uncharacterized LOC100382044 isoform X3 [Zea mays]